MAMKTADRWAMLSALMALAVLIPLTVLTWGALGWLERAFGVVLILAFGNIAGEGIRRWRR